MNPTDRVPYRPLNNRVLVRQDPAEAMVGKSKLIHAPQGSEHYPNNGTVLAIGPKVLDVPLQDDQGKPTRVIFKRRASTAIVPDEREDMTNPDKDLLMLFEEDILAVIESE